MFFVFVILTVRERVIWERRGEEEGKIRGGCVVLVLWMEFCYSRGAEVSSPYEEIDQLFF